MHTKFWSENLKGRGHSDDLDEDRRIILNWILRKESGNIWTGFVCPRLGTSGGLL
jgi:hypothetical protein